MGDQMSDLLNQVVQELRALRQDLAAIHADVAVFAEERRSVARMQSPLMGRDLFREPDPVERRD